MATSPIDPLPAVTLVLGGARSGKSLYAEGLLAGRPAAADGGAVYLATAEAGDAEMAARIARHRKRRGGRWRTVEEPLDLAARLADHGDGPVLVDCLTLWLANLIAAGRDPAAEVAALVGCLATVTGPVVLVSNEVGAGIVPDNALARAYRDHAGVMNQTVAGAAGRVVVVTAGLAQVLKDGHA